MKSTDLDTLQKVYCEGAAAAGSPDASVVNAGHDRMHAAYRALRETPDGRRAIMALMNHPSPHVAGWAASHSLQWEPNGARRILEALRDSGGPGSFDAEMTLRELDKGRLDVRYDY